ncbi:hypothetical protein EFW17_10100 [Halostreptopolyspora alba]|uniref:Metalloprotease n=2 Tax=Halostreptopolyspora alba TaxID=2487137 RepID=A0A3N0EB95_9ACTN|nr:hypothetical protein EFW17_10100 [Nocardiopsaceae bacterium YIM 96095]
MVAGLAAVLVGLALLVNSTGTSENNATGDAPSEYLAPGLDRPPPALDIDPENHPVYGVSRPEAVGCDLPELDTSSSASWEGFSEEVGVCLNELWQPRLESLGLRTDTPTFHVTEQNPDKLGQEGVTLAYYEGEKLSITVVLPNVMKLSESVPEGHVEGVWAALLGHEYGHHVQQVTGLLEAATELENEASSRSEALQALRRTELQAECLGGVAMRGFDTFDHAELGSINEFLNGGNDLPTHGTAQNRKYWFAEGRATDTIAACNTYEAEASLVR